MKDRQTPTPSPTIDVTSALDEANTVLYYERDEQKQPSQKDLEREARSMYHLCSKTGHDIRP